MKITKKSLTLIIIIAAALAVIIAAVIFVPGLVRRITHEPMDMMPNLTVIKCNAGKTIGDSDLRDVENIVRNIVGDKFLSAEKTEGFAPMLNLEARGYDIENMPEDEYEKTRKDLIGDRLVITCLMLTEDEWLDIYTAIALHFDFELADGEARHNPDINNIFRTEIAINEEIAEDYE